MHYLDSLFRVLVVGLMWGAGRPAICAPGGGAYGAGAGGVTADGTTQAPNPALKAVGLVLFAFVSLVIVAAILWITRGTVIHHFGVDPFPFLAKK